MERCHKIAIQRGGPLYFMAAYGPWLYAVLVTVLTFIAAIWIGRVAEKAKREETS